MQLAGQLAPGEREAGNADALEEGVRVGRGGLTSWQRLRTESKRRRRGFINCTTPTNWMTTSTRFWLREGSGSPRKSRRMPRATRTWQRSAGSSFPSGWRQERVSGWTVFVSRVESGAWRCLSKKAKGPHCGGTAGQHFSRSQGNPDATGSSETGFLRRRAPSGLEENRPGGYLSLEQAVGRSTLERQEEGLQGYDGSAAFQQGLAG